MRQIRDRLNDLLAALIAHLIEQNREDDRKRESEHEVQSADHQRIAQKAIEIEVSEELLEVIESYKLAAQNALDRLILLERDYIAVHRPIAEQYEV